MSTAPKKKERHSPWRIIGNALFLFRYLFKYTPGAMVWGMVNSVLSSAGNVLRSVVFVQFVFTSIEEEAPFRRVALGALILVGFNVLLSFVLNWIGNVPLPRSNHRLHQGMQSELYLRACDLDQSCYDDPEFYNDFIWAIRESDSRAVSLRQDLCSLLTNILTIFGTATALVAIDPFIGLFLFAFIPLGFVLRLLSNRLELAKKEEMNPLNRRMDYIKRVFYLTDHAKELRQGGIAEHLQADYSRHTDKKLAVERRYRGKQLTLALAIEMLAYWLFEMLIVVYLIVRYAAGNGFSLGSLSAGINAMWNIYAHTNRVMGSFAKFNEHSIYIEKFRRFIGYEPKVISGEAPVEDFREMRLENVCFSYGEGDKQKQVLHSIDLVLRRGEKVAFVGYNGAGKTTLTKLLMRLYDTTEGRVCYNGRDVRDYRLEEYRSHIGAVFQDYRLFAASVAENVVGGAYEEDKEEAVMSALHSASFEDRLAKMDEGIHTPLTREFEERGVELSGGESQKVAIARVFARPYDIIIMDEPSSALDPIAEYELNRSIAEDARDKTVIFISHRLSTTRMADRIYMFENGRIIEEGSHEAMMAKEGKYAEMFRIQAEKYLKGEA